MNSCGYTVLPANSIFTALQRFLYIAPVCVLNAINMEITIHSVFSAIWNLLKATTSTILVTSSCLYVQEPQKNNLACTVQKNLILFLKKSWHLFNFFVWLLIDYWFRTSDLNIYKFNTEFRRLKAYSGLL